EIGLDYACKVNRQRQEEFFKQQLLIAQRLKLPVVIHCVRAFDQVLKILQSYTLRGVIFHGFIGSKELATEVIKRGYFLSFGELTFRSQKTIEALRNTPLENLFLETDVSDTPIEEIYAKTAQITGVDMNKLIHSITNNYNKLFNI
ncbi:MAG: TatD family hydrolase, partial [Alistipes sp.]|nr:TatD family hydrolase [Alistipes sp.]